MAQIPFKQDVTIFTPGSDVIPVLGAYDAFANQVVDPTFSTDASHARPFMFGVIDAGSSEVSFADGTGTIGQVTIDILDKRQSPADQDSGIFTKLQAAADGDTAMLGVRMLARQVRFDGGAMEVLSDGVINKVSLLPGKYVTYRIVLRDIRDRERKVRLFTTASSTCIFPYVGPADGYGWQTQWDNTLQKYVRIGEPIMAPVSPAFGVFHAAAAVGGWSGGYVQFNLGKTLTIAGISIPLAGFNPAEAAIWNQRYTEIGDIWKTYCALAELVPPSNDLSTILGSYAYTGIILQWSTSPTGPWTNVVSPKVVPLFANPGSNALVFKKEKFKDQEFMIPDLLAFPIPAGDPQPVDGSNIYVRILSNKVPTDKVPLFIESNFGEMTKAIYDGGYSYPGLGMKIRYSPSAMTDYIRKTPKLTAKIIQPEEDGKAWMADNLYKPMMYAPAIVDGLVAPVSGELPDPSVPLLTLDNTNTFEADWEHGSDNIVNHIEFTYERDVIPSDFSDLGHILTQQIQIVRDRISSQDRHGAKPMTLAPVTVRSIIAGGNYGSVPNADTSSEVGSQVSARINEAFIRRFSNGAQSAVATCRASATYQVKVGDWVILAVSWLPDYKTGRRGISRLMQVTKVEKPEPHKRRFTLSDAGPFGQPVNQPRITSVTENSDGTVTIAVANIFVGALLLGANFRAEVQYAYGETQPATDSGEWKSVSSMLTADGSVVTPVNVSGVLFWSRVRGVADGVRPSAWTTPTSLRLSTRPVLKDMLLDIIPFDQTNPGHPLVYWSKSQFTNGVRVYYERYANGAAIPAITGTHFENFSAANARAVLSFALNQYENVVVQLEPWTGATGGTGTAGTKARQANAQRRDKPYVEPSIQVTSNRGGGLGTITISTTDPQLQVNAVYARVRVGNSGAFSAYTLLSGPPYAQSVTLVDGESSAIEYYVEAYDPDGVIRQVAHDIKEFSVTGLAIAQGTVSVAANGLATVAVDGPPIVARHKYMYSTTAFPADATVQASGADVFTRAWSANLLSLTFGQRLYVTDVPFDAAGNAMTAIHLTGAFISYTATKTWSFSAMAYEEITSSPWGMTHDSTDGGTAQVPILPSTGSQAFIAFSPLLPDGVTITNVSGYVNWPSGLGNSPSSVGLALYRGATYGAGTFLGNADGSSGATSAASFSLSEVTTGNAYTVVGHVTGHGGGGFGTVFITFFQPTPG